MKYIVVISVERGKRKLDKLKKNREGCLFDYHTFTNIPIICFDIRKKLGTLFSLRLNDTPTADDFAQLLIYSISGGDQQSQGNKQW